MAWAWTTSRRNAEAGVKNIEYRIKNKEKQLPRWVAAFACVRVLRGDGKRLFKGVCDRADDDDEYPPPSHRDFKPASHGHPGRLFMFRVPDEVRVAGLADVAAA